MENFEKIFGTLRISDERKPPNQRKHRSAGVFHMPDNMWNTSDLAPLLFNFQMLSYCAMAPSTTMRSSASLAWALTAVLSSLICRFCSSSHRAYSISNAKAPTNNLIRKKKLNNFKSIRQKTVITSSQTLTSKYSRPLGNNQMYSFT